MLVIGFLAIGLYALAVGDYWPALAAFSLALLLLIEVKGLTE